MLQVKIIINSKNIEPDKNINVILFDGYCGLCNRFVNFLLRKDKSKKLHFASQQSEFAGKILKERTKGIDAIFYLHSGRLYSKSTAVIKIICDLGGIWKLGIMSLIIPAFLRNLFYDWIARKRYLWFGRKNHCYSPKPEFKERFLESSKD